ncbi:TAXI family TRAP transporter solute-binding subunit [Alkalihalobacillus sp. BA299]|uniref:TAXI family TRAP transporter solute-binding subunit n=1 Tax=Alkalihalobacillus sp. BA299 TaxID=2815938 RepID=UPI001ADB856C|nr:TAXI family TRAP transporter solute-binding subunit [Alkalihalobacillus sp. BA299]
MKKPVSFFLFVLLALSLIACSSGNGSNAEQSSSNPSETPNSGGSQFLTIGTAGTGGAYYPIGISIAKIAEDQLGASATAQVTGGALENIGLVQNAEVDIAVTQSPMAVAGLNGTEPYKQQNDNIATLFNGLSKGIFQLVVMESSGINSVADLKGKKVVLGPSGGGAINVITDILSVYDLGVDDLDPTYVAYNEGITMLSDNNVDAVIVQSAAPAPAIKELEASKNEFKLISIEPDKLEVLLEKYSYLDQIELSQDMYATKNATNTVYLTNMMIVRKDLDEEFVYNLTKSIFENIQQVQASHPAAKELSLELQAKKAPIPLHPGAKRYFEEQGVIE